MIAVIVAGFSIAYLYLSADIFVDILKKPIKSISWGMFFIDVGVMLVTLISYEATQGVQLEIFGVSLSVYFYAFYFVGSALIVFGARQFSRRPKINQTP